MMPDVKHCYVEDCYYNKNKMCHAEAITVGSIEPKCDTFYKSNKHGGPAPLGHVGACHIGNCRWNKDLTCSAQGIDISLHGAEPECDTFKEA